MAANPPQHNRCGHGSLYCAGTRSLEEARATQNEMANTAQSAMGRPSIWTVRALEASADGGSFKSGFAWFFAFCSIDVLLVPIGARIYPSVIDSCSCCGCSHFSARATTSAGHTASHAVIQPPTLSSSSLATASALEQGQHTALPRRRAANGNINQRI